MLAGKSEFFLHGLVGGSSGVIAALVNLAPKTHVELYKRYQAGDIKGAKAIQDVLCDADGAQAKLGVAGLKVRLPLGRRMLNEAGGRRQVLRLRYWHRPKPVTQCWC